MVPLETVAGRPLAWAQPDAHARRFELRDGERVLAALTFETPFGSLAVGEAGGGRWSFKRVGFLRPRVTAREAGAAKNVAVFHPRSMGDGALELTTGASFDWQSLNVWGTEWAFTGPGGPPLYILKPGAEPSDPSEVARHHATVTIRPEGVALIELPLLILIGWYLTILRHEDIATSTAVIEEME